MRRRQKWAQQQYKSIYLESEMCLTFGFQGSFGQICPFKRLTFCSQAVVQRFDFSAHCESNRSRVRRTALWIDGEGDTEQLMKLVSEINLLKSPAVDSSRQNLQRLEQDRGLCVLVMELKRISISLSILSNHC